MKRALITGITGQDGSYLAEQLLAKEYEVHGTIRRTALYPDSLQNISHLLDRVELHFADLLNESQLCFLLSELKPTEVYNLAAQSDVRISFDIPEYTIDVVGLGVVRLLEAIRKFSPQSKLYQASSSEMFGDSAPPQNELTPFRPLSPYGAAKYFAHCMARIYRESYGLFVASGILFNHESPKRGKNFVTRKITSTIKAITEGKVNKLYLGNLDGKRDWGYAPDYCEAMWSMLQQDTPSDYVIGTGEAHTVKDFVVEAFSYYNLDWRDYVEIDPRLYRPIEVNYLLADATKARKELNWKPTTTFRELVRIMTQYERSTLEV